MKNLNKFWIVVSVIIAFIVMVKLYDCYVTIKYEIDEPKAIGKMSSLLQEREKTIRQLIFWLWLILGYTLFSIGLSIKWLMK